jgi:hypothetical protein
MGFKEFNEYSAEEIGLWLIAQGLGEHAPKFLAVGVDGDLLLALSVDDIKNDLGLSGLQAKKLMKNIEFAKMIGASPINKLVIEIDELEVKVQVSQHAGKTKDCEIAELRSEKLSSKHLVSRFAENVQALQHEAKTKDRKIAELRRRNIYYYRQFVVSSFRTPSCAFFLNATVHAMDCLLLNFFCQTFRNRCCA